MVAVVLLAVWANVAIFTWLYAPVMLGADFTVLVLLTIAALVVRNSCLCRAKGR
jgi:hypothetical protein